MKSVHVFLYGADRTGSVAGVASERVAEASLPGTLFDVAGVGLALMLAGSQRVRGSVVRVDAADLDVLDARARVREGLYRRVGVEVDGTPCWTWVAGPALAPRLAPELRVRRGSEDVE